MSARGSTDRPVAAALAEAADAARLAPSVHNTQPWRWHVDPDALQLRADRSRSLPVADPHGRLLTMSCGAALHHARVALATEGWQVEVERFPSPDDPDHLARVTVSGRAPVSAEAMRLFQTTRVRHTDRRPVTDAPVPAETLQAMRRAAEAEGVHLHVVRPEDVATLASAVARADAVGLTDPALRAETAAWVGGPDERSTGLPDSVIPARPGQTAVPGRDFGRLGRLAVGVGHDRYASYAILFGPGDGPEDWLRAGEALSAAWLTAVERGAAVVPITSAVEVGGTREVLRRMLAGLGNPYAALRVGIPDAEHAGPAHTGRLAGEQVIDTTPEGPAA